MKKFDRMACLSEVKAVLQRYACPAYIIGMGEETDDEFMFTSIAGGAAAGQANLHAIATMIAGLIIDAERHDIDLGSYVAGLKEKEKLVNKGVH